MRVGTRECGLSCARDAVSLKHDYLWTREPESFVATRQLVRESVKDYNTARPHSSLNYLTPAEYGRKKMEESRT